MSLRNNNYSPLRYPGGKATLKNFLIDIITANNLEGGTYVEPYAGGSGAALSLLFSDYVYQIYLNDKDRFIYSFWYSVLNDTEEFCRKISNCRISVTQWEKHHKKISDSSYERDGDTLEMAMTCFYLNRTNRSGILRAGPIGGKNQDGNYKIDARFNKKDLISRIQKIALFRNRIRLFNSDAVVFLNYLFEDFNLNEEKLLIYLDPPYDVMGKEVYRHFYKKDDHQDLSDFLQRAINFRWLLSYDDTDLINSLYQTNDKNYLDKNYFINKAKVGRELIISSDNLVLPKEYKINPTELFTKSAQPLSI